MARYTVNENFEKLKVGNAKYGGKTVPVGLESYAYFVLLCSAFRRSAKSVAIRTIDAYQTYSDTCDRAWTVYHSIRYDRPQAGKNDSRGNPASTSEVALWQRDQAAEKFRADLIGPMAAVKVYMSLLDSIRTMYGHHAQAADLVTITTYALTYGLRISDLFMHKEILPVRIALRVSRFTPGDRKTSFLYRCARDGKGTLTFPRLTEEEIEAMRFVHETSSYDHLVRRYIHDTPMVTCDQDLIEAGQVKDAVTTIHGTHYYLTPDFTRYLTASYASWAVHSYLIPVCQSYIAGDDADTLAKTIAYGACKSGSAVDLMERSPALLRAACLYLPKEQIPVYDPKTGTFDEPMAVAN